MSKYNHQRAYFWTEMYKTSLLLQAGNNEGQLNATSPNVATQFANLCLVDFEAKFKEEDFEDTNKQLEHLMDKYQEITNSILGPFDLDDAPGHIDESIEGSIEYPNPHYRKDE